MRSIVEVLRRSRLHKYLLIVLVLSVSAAVVNADHGPVLPPLHTFSAGTTAKASEVNENFKYLEDRSWDLTPAPATDLFYMGGKVGIGTATPSAELEVVGTVKATAFEGNGALSLGGTGNVGIGTTSPEAKLTVQGSETTTHGKEAAIQLTNTAATVDNHWMLRAGGAGTQTPDGGFSIADKNLYRLAIDSTGNVGIGTTSPIGKLDVRPVGGVASFYVVSSGDLYPRLYMGGTDETVAGVINRIKPAANLFFGEDPDTGGYLFRGTGEINIGSNRLVVKNGGDVGIGTTSPNHLLTVGAPDTPLVITAKAGIYNAGGAYLIIRDTTNDSEGLIGAEIGSTVVGAMTDHALVFRAGNNVGAGNVEYMRIERGGNVGIGTTNPGYKLHVNGSVAGVGGYNALSDLRYKKNIRAVANALDKITGLQGVNFDWRQDEFPNLNFDDGEQIGFIAQEIKEILPEVVSRDSEGYYAVAYSGVVPVLVEAIKEQQRIIAGQQKVINEQGSELAKMEARMAKFEAALDKLETLTAAR